MIDAMIWLERALKNIENINFYLINNQIDVLINWYFQVILI